MAVVTHMASPRGSNGRQTIRRFASHGLAHPARGKPLDPGQCGASLLTVQDTPPPPPRREGDTMPFETQGPEPLAAVIHVRLTAAEKARANEAADPAGTGMS